MESCEFDHSFLFILNPDMGQNKGSVILFYTKIPKSVKINWVQGTGAASSLLKIVLLLAAVNSKKENHIECSAEALPKKFWPFPKFYRTSRGFLESRIKYSPDFLLSFSSFLHVVKKKCLGEYIHTPAFYLAFFDIVWLSYWPFRRVMNNKHF